MGWEYKINEDGSFSAVNKELYYNIIFPVNFLNNNKPFETIDEGIKCLKIFFPFLFEEQEESMDTTSIVE